MPMITRCALVLLGVAASACAAPRSTFQFVLAGDVSENVMSAAVVTGAVDNSGNLNLEDDAWAITMALPGSAPSPQGESAALTLLDKQTADTFTGTCQVIVDNHQDTNGSAFAGTFTCTTLASTDGTKHVELKGGEFHTQVDDSSNNPNSCAIPPCN
jgi:hypothetical protein